MADELIDPASELQRLVELRDSGAITNAEFHRLRVPVLAQLGIRVNDEQPARNGASRPATPTATTVVVVLGVALSLAIFAVGGYVLWQLGSGDGELSNPFDALREWATTDSQKAWDLGESIYFDDTVLVYDAVAANTCETLTYFHEQATEYIADGSDDVATELMTEIRAGIVGELNLAASRADLPAVYVQSGFWDAVIVNCPKAMFDLSGYAGRP